MIPLNPIETDPLLFDKLLEPLEPVLQQLDREPLPQAAGKLKSQPSLPAFFRRWTFEIGML